MTTRPVLVPTLALLLPTAGVAHAQTIRWNMANEYPATSIQGEADARFAREVGERTGGRIQIVHQYDAASGIRSQDMVDAIARGLAADRQHVHGCGRRGRTGLRAAVAAVPRLVAG
jgi:TRAP-type C4-dicarboxylate transport system substrate-binding protein